MQTMEPPMAPTQAPVEPNVSAAGGMTNLNAYLQSGNFVTLDEGSVLPNLSLSGGAYAKSDANYHDLSEFS